MTVNTTAKTGVDLTLPTGSWRTLAKAVMPAGAESHSMFYGNFFGTVAAGECCGTITVRALRDGGLDETSLHDYTVRRRKDGTFRHKVTLTWFGARPGQTLHWQVLVDAESIATAKAKGSYYGKGMNN